MSTEPMISTQILQPIVQYLREAGHRAAPILEKLGVERRLLLDINAMIPMRKYMHFFEMAATVSGNYRFGLDIGKKTTDSSLGAIGFLFFSAPTLQAAFEGLTTYLDAVQEGTIVTLQITDQHAVYEYKILDDAISPRRQDSEYSMAATYALIRNYVGRHFAPIEICFEHERIGNHSYYENHFGCNVFFEQPTNYLMFDKSYLAISAPAISKKLYPIIASHLGNIAASKEHVETLTDQINSLIDERMLTKGVTLQKISRSLGISESTLARRLKSEGSGFNEILTDRRMKVAERLLAYGETTIGDIALSIGYSENASFTRAFKAWSRLTPEQYRRKARDHRTI